MLLLLHVRVVMRVMRMMMGMVMRSQRVLVETGVGRTDWR